MAKCIHTCKTLQAMSNISWTLRTAAWVPSSSFSWKSSVFGIITQGTRKDAKERFVSQPVSDDPPQSDPHCCFKILQHKILDRTSWKLCQKLGSEYYTQYSTLYATLKPKLNIPWWIQSHPWPYHSVTLPMSPISVRLAFLWMILRTEVKWAWYTFKCVQ